MRVQAIKYDPPSFTDELYQSALLLLDAESAVKVKKFFRREDACRTLIGRFLPRMLLHAQGISLANIKFAATASGKPYFASRHTLDCFHLINAASSQAPGTVDPPIAYNVSHDNGLVAMVSSTNPHNPPAFSIGVDVMKVRVPGRESFKSFVQTMSEQLTTLEQRVVLGAANEKQGLEYFFWIWTAKEAYTKALGLGLGFDFRRIEYNPALDLLKVDGAVPKGWQLNKFTVLQGTDLYQGVVAEFVAGEETIVVAESGPHDWLEVIDATVFIQEAIQQLGSQ